MLKRQITICFKYILATIRSLVYHTMWTRDFTYLIQTVYLEKQSFAAGEMLTVISILIETQATGVPGYSK